MATTAAKFHLQPGMTLLLLHAPREHRGVFDVVPAGCTVRTRAGGSAGLVLLFAASKKELTVRFPAARASPGDDTPLWIA
jgi:hypothetical protein